jgi:hypothetical protein
VTFYADGNPVSSAPVANDSASITTASLSSGMHSLTCTYSGDAMFAASTCAPAFVTVKNVSTTVALVSNASPTPALSSVTFTANLTAHNQPFSATILFYIDGAYIKAVATNVNGNASYTTTLSAGTHTVNVQFAGTGAYDPSHASLTEVAAPNPTTTALTPPAGTVYQNQLFTVLSAVNAGTGTSSPNGTVTLSEGAAVLAQAIPPPSVSGTTATTLRLTIPSLAAGTHTLIATYRPADGNFLPSTSQTLSVVVIPQSFTLSISTPTLSIPTEHHKSFTASVLSLGAFQGPVQLTCAVPQNVYLTCDISKSLLLLAFNSSATSDITLDTDAVPYFKSSLESGPRPGAFGSQAIAVALLLPVTLGYLAHRRRLRTLPPMLFLFALASTLSLTACSGKYPAHTPPGNYDIAISATGTSTGSTAGVTQTVHMQLTIVPE